jgi:hypothetical protein
MSLREEIELERKKHLGLDEINTKKIYNIIIDYYKKKLIEAPREIIGYAIDIVVCNMNYYNKLGKLEDINSNWCDNNLYVDLKNSAFIGLEVQENGNIESNDEDIVLNDISEFKKIENVAFSLKEIIELCKKDNFSIRIYAKDDENYETTIEIDPYMAFNMNESIKSYLDSLK